MTVFENRGNEVMGIHHYQMPETYNGVSIRAVVSAGGMDDASVGLMGAHHWLEHMLFEGSEKYQDGMLPVLSGLTELGGSWNARTTHQTTVFEIYAFRDRYFEACEALGQLLGKPLLMASAAEKQKKIILSEISESEDDEKNVDPFQKAIRDILLRDHVSLQKILGNAAEIKNADPLIPRRAWNLGFDASRISFFTAGHLSDQQIRDGVSILQDNIPSRGIVPITLPRKSVLQVPTASPGRYSLPGGSLETATSSIIFPLPPIHDVRTGGVHRMANELLQSGVPFHPLLQVLREEKHLVYSVVPYLQMGADGSWLEVSCKTVPDHLQEVQRLVFEILASDRCRNRQQFDKVKKIREGALALDPLHPNQITNMAVSVYTSTGAPSDPLSINDLEEGISFEEACAVLDNCTEEKAIICDTGSLIS